MHVLRRLEIRDTPLRCVARIGKDIPELGRLSVRCASPIRLSRSKDRGMGVIRALSPSFGASTLMVFKARIPADGNGNPTSPRACGLDCL